MPHLVTGLMGLLLVSSTALAASKIKEKDLQVITLQEGYMTTANRGYPVPQLKCTSNCAHAPKSVQCYNRGFDGQAVNWECKASLPSGVTFGNIDVSCEGYSYPDDEYITIGSCGLNYNLVGSPNGQGSSHWTSTKTKYKDDDSQSVIQTLLTWIVVIFLIMYFLKCCGTQHDYARSDQTYPDDNRGTGYYGGGNPGGPPGGPGFRPDFNSSGGTRCGGRGADAPPHQDGPGFWSGLATGGMFGYMFGRNADGYGANYQNVYPRRGYTDHSDTWGSSGPSTSSSSTTYQSSSGFARTSRR